MPLSNKLFDTALSHEIKKVIKARVVADALKDISYLKEHIKNTFDSNPQDNQFLFTVWYQSEWVVIEYDKSVKKYIAYTSLKLPYHNLTYESPSKSPLAEMFAVFSLIYENLKTIDLEQNFQSSLKGIGFSQAPIKIPNSFFYILNDESKHQYYLYKMMPGYWLNLVIQGNQALIYGKKEDLKSCNIESVKKNIGTCLANKNLTYQIVEQSSTIPSFLNALNNLVQIQEKIEPTPVVHYKLIEAFAELAWVRLPKKEASSFDWEELFAKLEGIGISFEEDNSKFFFNGQDKPHVSLIAIEVDDSQQDYEPPIFIYYENKNEKFILAKQQTYDKYEHLISGYKSQNVTWIKHKNDLDLDDYCYQVLSQIQDGKDCKLLDFITDETSSIDSTTSDSTSHGENLSFFKPNPSPQNASSKPWMSRDTLINSVLFALGAGCIVAFGLTMAVPALLIGLFLFSIMTLHVLKPSPKLPAPTSLQSQIHVSNALF